jgi:hypothetical protein
MITEKFNTETGLLESKWEGEVQLSEIIDYIVRTKENTNYPRHLKIITSAENAILSLNFQDLKQISEENKLSVERYSAIIDAFVVDKAVEAALTTMYEQVSEIRGYTFKVFSTKEAALEWLDLM